MASKRVWQIVSSPTNEVWITSSSETPLWSGKHSIAVYLWNQETDSFVINPHKPSAWKDEELN
ncbi:MAG: hypothetical protein IPJ40_13165 [Saprospirales bacterium]|nr:hypothetical protein [Saprospirales bacterium]